MPHRSQPLPPLSASDLRPARARARARWQPEFRALLASLALILLAALPLQADEPPAALRASLEAWIAAQEATPARDAPSFVRWRRAFPDLEAELIRCAKEPPPLGPRAQALLSVVATRAELLPPGPLRERVLGRQRLLGQLEAETLGPQAAAGLDPLAGETLRELAGDPLGGAWRSAALRALAGRSEGLETLRRVAAAGGEHVSPAGRGLVSRGDTKGIFAALDAALQRGSAREAGVFLRYAFDLGEGRPPLERIRGILRSEAPLQARATLARALGAEGWRELQGALRRLLREPHLSGGTRAGVTAAYLRLGGSGQDLPAELLAELSSASLGAGPQAEEAFLGLAALPPGLASAALRLELRRPDPAGARRARAVHAAEALGLTQLAPVLRQLWRDATQPHLARAAAAHALGTFGGSEDQAALVLLRDPSPALRRAALAALVRIPPAHRVPASQRVLSEALADPEPALREVALDALRGPEDLPVLRAALRQARPSLVSPREVQAWLERAAQLSLQDPAPAEWLLSRWRSRPELRASLPLAQATLAYAKVLSASLAVPVLLDLLEHREREAAQAAQAELVRRYSPGRAFGGDLAAWRRAWREQPALFR